MPGDGNWSVAEGDAEPHEDVDLPSILAALDATDEDARLEAVRTIRAAVEAEPRSCVPTVPKLRRLLERGTGFDELVLSCLADLAAAAPNDVAPSVEAVAAFATAKPSHPGTTHALRCLAHVADDRPDAVAEHVADVVAAVEADAGIDPWGTRLFSTLAETHPRAVEPALDALSAALEREPETHGADALDALCRLARADPAHVPAFLEAVETLLRHDDPALRAAAVDRLSTVARAVPAAIGDDARAVAATLEDLAASDPSPEVREGAERALRALARTDMRAP